MAETNGELSWFIEKWLDTKAVPGQKIFKPKKFKPYKGYKITPELLKSKKFALDFSCGFYSTIGLLKKPHCRPKFQSENSSWLIYEDLTDKKRKILEYRYNAKKKYYFPVGKVFTLNREACKYG